MSKIKQSPIQIDGSYGEGGGQIIRTALSLSMITGTPICIQNIRANRKKSGLMRQHLACVQASQQISHAEVMGASLGSTKLTFAPNTIQAGEYHFDIGSAGSTNLVLQTLLPVLLFARYCENFDKNQHGQNGTQIYSKVMIKGGTHNPLAPTSDFIQLAFLPVLQKLGICVDYKLKQAGFVPLGGGEICVKIPTLANTINMVKEQNLPPFKLIERGELLAVQLFASHLNLDYDICKRELASCQANLDGVIEPSLIHTQALKLKGIGEGNTCYVVVKFTNHQEVITLLGEKRISAEKMGNRLAGLIKRYLCKSDACIEEYLCDQLLLPLALTSGGEFTTREVSEHSRTQAWLIEQFLEVKIEFTQIEEHKFLVTVNKTKK